MFYNMISIMLIKVENNFIDFSSEIINMKI